MNILVITNQNPYAQAAAVSMAQQGHQVFAAVETAAEAECFSDTKVQALLLPEQTVAPVTNMLNTFDTLDILVFGIGARNEKSGAIGSGIDTAQLLSVLDKNLNGMKDILFTATPLMQKSKGKRICMITNQASSISHSRAKTDFAKNMTLAGCNMIGKLAFNRLRPEGFTFRWYCADDGQGGMDAATYILTGLCYDPKEPYIHSDENRLVMRDRYLREIPW